MSFFENTRKPKGFSGKLMVKMMNNGHANLAQWGLSYVHPNGNEKILDAGCGGGANIAKWLQLCPKSLVIGLDYSKVSVAEAKKCNQSAIDDGRCQILNGDVSKLPFEQKTFDYVSAFETVYFWPDIENTFKGIYSVLKENGTFLIVNEIDGTNPKDEKWTSAIPGMKIYKAEELKQLLMSSGFNKVEINTNSKKHWICLIAQK